MHATGPEEASSNDVLIGEISNLVSTGSEQQFVFNGALNGFISRKIGELVISMGSEGDPSDDVTPVKIALVEISELVIPIESEEAPSDGAIAVNTSELPIPMGSAESPPNGVIPIKPSN